MADYTIYHNPRCSKSRETLALLEDNGIEPSVVLYLNEPPSTAVLKAIITKLGITARDLLRNKEADYKALNLSNSSLDDNALIAAMIKYPKLIERPIVIKGDRAILGRPPKNVLALL